MLTQSYETQVIIVAILTSANSTHFTEIMLNVTKPWASLSNCQMKPAYHLNHVAVWSKFSVTSVTNRHKLQTQLSWEREGGVKALIYLLTKREYLNNRLQFTYVGKARLANQVGRRGWINPASEQNTQNIGATFVRNQSTSSQRCLGSSFAWSMPYQSVSAAVRPCQQKSSHSLPGAGCCGPVTFQHELLSAW